jgi:two-component system phosphate regulon sensor histidine kinase PhoR
VREQPLRERLLYFVLTPAIVIAIMVLGWLALRTTLQIEKARQQTVLDATLTLAAERVEVLDKFVIAQDNVVAAHVDLADLAAIGRRWKSTALRETPTVRAILLLDMTSESREVLAFHSLAPGPENDTFRRLLLLHLMPEMNLAENIEELRHLHLVVDEQSYLISYWQRRFEGRTYMVAVWHDVPRVVHETLPRLYREPDRGPSRMNIIDEQGRIVFGPPIQGGAFTVGLPFPTTLYNWRLQIALSSADELAEKVQRRQLIELSMVSVAGLVAVIGLIIVLLAAAKERRVSTLKSDFVANVSHELKTPLALVRMFGELLLLDRVKSDDKRRQYLQIIVGESERLTALIDNVLDFAKVERGKAAYDFVPGDVGDVVARAVEVYRYRAEREEVAVELELEDDLPGARIDARALELAVINLLDNALKYAKDGGSIDVSVRARGRDVEVRVADRGPGIQPSEQERIFDRFVRGSAAQSRAVRGSGIGLALVKYIAEAHGGRVRVESPIFDDGTGTAFVVALPALARPAWDRPSERPQLPAAPAAPPSDPLPSDAAAAGTAQPAAEPTPPAKAGASVAPEA